ncbi:MAG: SsrA-binding protein SmpB [Chlamydiae bacterium]|nr:SsrA-binding protein SmpB [Chlamydiota bacterium]
MKNQSNSELASNRKAWHNYEILETFEAGIILVGTEVKSLRAHQVSLQEAYVLVTDRNDIILKNASIAPYKFGTIFNHEERRERKLLLHKREIADLRRFSQEKGLTIIPLSIYLKKGLIKVKIGVARGKKAFDKRRAIKEREEKRKIQQILRHKT